MSSQVELSTSRACGETREIRKRKGTPWVRKTNCHGQEKRVGVAHPLSWRWQAGGWTTPASKHSPDLFTHSPSAPHRVFPLDLTPRSKSSYLPVVVPSLPATAVPAEEDSLTRLPLKGCPWCSANEDNRANTCCIIVSVLRSGERNSRL